jgi:hypothetical protein
MSARLEDRWYSTEWHRALGRYELTVSEWDESFQWEVWLGRTLKKVGWKPDEKAAKLAARRWVEANP